MNDSALTNYGFTWGPATIQRMSEIDGATCTQIRTDAHKLNVYVSPKGRSIRAWLDGQELK